MKRSEKVIIGLAALFIGVPALLFLGPRLYFAATGHSYYSVPSASIKPTLLPGDVFHSGKARSDPVLNINDTPADNQQEITVAEGHILYLGDNRDNALDGRFPQAAGGPGFVPVENVVSRGAVLQYALAKSEDGGWQPFERYFKRLQ